MRHKSRIVGSIVVLLIFSLALPARARPPTQPPPPRSDEALIAQLERETGGAVRLSYHTGTGRLRFIGTTLDRPIGQPALLAVGASPEDAARGFLAVYGPLFGLKDPARELQVERVRTADRGRSSVRFQQVYESIPVLGGELIVQVNASNDILFASGEILPDLSLDITPRVAAEAARLNALEAVAREYGLATEDLTASEPELWVYNPLLLGAPGIPVSRLVWRIEVTPLDLLPIRELVLVDAQRGFVTLQFNQIDTAKNRRIYDNQNNPAYGIPGNGPVRTEGGPATGVTDADNAYDYAGFTYDFYWTYHGRDSLNNAGMALTNTVRYCPDAANCPYQNAFWNGYQMVYGAGYASADDVVAHEMTHGVTQYESNLFYYMQSGAINEALSDIWGELVDLTYTNGKDNDSPSVRWLMGENLPVGAGRSMSNPPLYGQPDRMTSPYYYCGTQDNGGVHYNSGVANKAAYLMVDGGTFNGRTVTALGINKTVKIWYEAQTNLLLSGSDYQDLYDALYQACLNLVGTGGITTSDCQEVRDATEATEMDEQPSGCAATDAPLCYFGDPTSTLFYDNFEAGVGNWTSGANQGSDEWYYESAYATSGTHHLYGYDQPSTADYYVAMVSNVSLPAGQEVFLHFKHAYDFEGPSYDGGVLEYSANGGPWTDAGSLFTYNGYDGTISTGSGNPLGGRSGFIAESYGYISSRLNLTSLAGKNVRFRYRIGTNSSGEDWGWFIDDVRIYTCPSGSYSYIYLPLVVRNYPKHLLNSNFENGRDGSWSESSSHGWPLIIHEGDTPVDAHGGSWLAWLGGGNNETSILSQDVTIPSSATTLNYWYWGASQDSCGYDYAYVRFGSITLRTHNLCQSNNTGGWVSQQINIAAYRGQTVNLRFVVTTDSSLNSNFFLDDVSISTGTTFSIAPPSDQPESFRADPEVEKSRVFH